MIWRYLEPFSIFVPLMYPTDCIISVKDLNTKEKLISGGITLKNRSVNFLDVEKTITIPLKNLVLK
jgi:hypothetical protein